MKASGSGTRGAAVLGALTICGLTWTLSGVLAIVSVSASAVAMGALPLIPGGFGWLASTADGLLGTWRLALAILMAAAGLAALAIGLLDLACVDLHSKTMVRGSYASLRGLLAANVLLGIVTPLIAWVFFGGGRMVLVGLAH